MDLNACRVCSGGHQELLNIFDSDGTMQIHMKVMECASVQIYEGDLMPNKICCPCKAQVDIAYTFKKTCEMTQQRLQSLLSDSTAVIKKEVTQILDIGASELIGEQALITTEGDEVGGEDIIQPIKYVKVEIKDEIVNDHNLCTDDDNELTPVISQTTNETGGFEPTLVSSKHVNQCIDELSPSSIKQQLSDFGSSFPDSLLSNEGNLIKLTPVTGEHIRLPISQTMHGSITSKKVSQCSHGLPAPLIVTEVSDCDAQLPISLASNKFDSVKPTHASEHVMQVNSSLSPPLINQQVSDALVVPNQSDLMEPPQRPTLPLPLINAGDSDYDVSLPASASLVANKRNSNEPTNTSSEHLREGNVTLPPPLMNEQLGDYDVKLPNSQTSNGGNVKIAANSKSVKPQMPAYKNLVCECCGIKFNSITSKRRHIMLREAKFYCEVCTRVFAFLSDLKRHRCLGVPSGPNVAENLPKVKPSAKRKRKQKAVVKSEKAMPKVKSSVKRKIKDEDVVKSNDKKTVLCTIDLTESEKKQRSTESGKKQRPTESEKKQRPTESEKKQRPTESEKKLPQSTKFTYECGICKQKFLNPYDLTLHVEKHTRPGRFSCLTCGKAYNQQPSLSRHMKIHAFHRCKICKKQLSTGKLLFEHLHKHIGTKDYTSLMKMHNIRYTCESCRRSFATETDHQRHMALHSDSIRKFDCKKCLSSFVSKLQLKRHMGLHLRGHECRECSKPFAFLKTLARHMESHPGLGLKCGLCGVTCTGLHNLQKHMKAHLSKYKCAVCDHTASSEMALLKHALSHVFPYDKGLNKRK